MVFMTLAIIRDGLEADSVADWVDFAYQGAGSEATPPRPADWAGLAGGALIGVGAVLEVVYTFLIYPELVTGSQRLALLLLIVLAVAVQVVSAALIVAGSWPTAAPEWPDSHARRRVYGGLLGASLSAICLVNSLATLGEVLPVLNQVPYLPLSETWWLPVAVGSGLALIRKGGLARVGRPARPRRADALPLALLTITVVGALANSLPAWVQYTFTGSTGPHSEELTTAYTAPWIEFGGPWAEIAGSVGQIVAIIAIAAAAALWRPPRFGAVLLTGVVFSLISDAITGIGAVTEAPPRYFFGIPAAVRMTISVAGTPWLWAFCGFTVALIVVYEWLFIRSRPRPGHPAAAVTWMESAAPGTADDSLWPLPRSHTGEAAFVRENVVGTPYSDEL
jgi:hypothetical protein